MLNAWNQAVGEPTKDLTDLESDQIAFFSDETVNQQLADLSKSEDAAIQERAQGWIRLRKQDGMQQHESIVPLTTKIVEAMDGAPDHPLHGTGALMTIYSSDDPVARDEALKEIQQRSSTMLPILAERSVALNQLAQSHGYADFVHAQTGLPVQAATQQIEETCSAQLESTQSDWERLLQRGEKKLGRTSTDADWVSLSTSWSAEAGFFLKSDAFYPLSGRALKKMGFDLDAMNIEIRETPGQPGGAAYDISVPDDIRFHGHFMDGFEGARGWFHELGHAVHMKEVKETQAPFNELPFERALSEGVGEVFGAIVRDAAWIEAEFPDLNEEQLADYVAATKGLDAIVLRYNCYQTRLELALYAGELDVERLNTIHKDVFGSPAKYGATYPMYIYLGRPLYIWEYVISSVVTNTLLEQLGGQSLVSQEGGSILRTKMLAPGAKLTLKDYLENP